MPVFFEMGSVAQLTYGLLVCFLSFGAFTLLQPYASDSDDRLAQLCQVQVFFALVASIILNWQDDQESEGIERNSGLDAILCVFTFVPITFAAIVHALEEGLGDLLKECLRPVNERIEPYVERYITPKWRKIQGEARSVIELACAGEQPPAIKG